MIDPLTQYLDQTNPSALDNLESWVNGYRLDEGTPGAPQEDELDFDPEELIEELKL